MNSVGITGGIGSLQYGAKKAGFKVIGNIEWRKYYHSGTFEYNFKNAFMVESWEDLTDDQKQSLIDIDLATGHPDCGAYSNLNTGKSKNQANPSCKSDIPLFLELVNHIKPKFFLMDNLPKSLIGNTIEDWIEALPDYELHPEFISNHHYGNVQKHRKRFFMIGCRRDIAEKTGFIFIPGETEQSSDLTVQTVLTPYLNKYGEFNNHYIPNPDATLGVLIVNKKGDGNIKPKLKDAAEMFKSFGPGYILRYYSENYKCVKTKPGRNVLHWEGSANTLTGIYSTSFHPITGYHLSTRERAAIQGIGDEFKFIHKKELDKEGYSTGNSDLIKQTGKCMPVQFPEYFARQIKYALEKGDNKKALINNANRLINSNEYVNDAKFKYCQHCADNGVVAYSNQELACKMCSARTLCDERTK